VVASLGTCPGPATTTSVIINSSPIAPTAGSNSTVCSGNTLSLTASTIGGATYSWTGPNSFSSAVQNPTIAIVTTAASGTYSVTATSGGCTGPAGTTSVTISQAPAAPVAGSNTPVCSGNTLSLTASSTGTTYSWTGPNSFSSAVQNPTIAAVTTAASGTYSVTATTAGCTGPAGTTSVTINPGPAAPVAGSNTPVCSGNTLSLTSSTVAGASGYSWTGPNSFSSAVQNPTIAVVTTAASGTYTVIATVPGCGTLSGTTVVTINQTPAAPVAGSNTPICSGNTLSLTASSTGTTYSWTGPNTFSSAVQNPTIAAVTTAASGTY
jgi:hypothetical protein